MKKLIAALGIVFIVFCTNPSTMALAAPSKPVDNASACQTQYDKQYEKDLIKIEKAVEQANAYIEKEVAKAQATPRDDVDQLLHKIAVRVENVMRLADRLGYVVECDYVEYYIDGRYVMIDPLRVVNKIVGE